MFFMFQTLILTFCPFLNLSITIVIKSFFSGDSCIIQDVKLLRMIGLAKLKQGLYHLVINKASQPLTQCSSFVNSSTTSPIPTNHIWHYKLGHLSGKCLHILHEQFPFISKYLNEHCDVCHLAKKLKLSHFSSHNRASKSFYLLHMDILGPFSKASIHGHNSQIFSNHC